MHVFVVIVLDTVAMMMVMGAMIVVAMIMMMIVVMVMVFSFQKIRFDVQDAIEIEGVTAKYLGNVNFGALGAMEARIRVERPDMRFHIAQFLRSSPGRFC